MPFSLEQFMSEVRKVNPNFRRILSSDLDPLIAALNKGGKSGVFTDLQRQEIQRAYAFTPYEKQQKYRAAIDYLKRELGAFADAIPSEPSMALHRFQTNIGSYLGVNSKGDRKTVELPLRSYHHLCRFTWKSSNGNMESLRNVGTREHVKFTREPDGPPFNYVQAGTPREFTQGATTNNGANCGLNDDDHSTVIPALICTNPRQPGSLVAEQWYQYTADGRTWHNIPGAAYLIEKGVRQGKGGLVYYFKKTNWEQHNRKRFHLEVEYAIGPQPDYMPVPGTKVAKALNEDADLSKHALRIVSPG